jgi:hypothetical protein
MKEKALNINRKPSFWKSILIFLAVMGPGIVTGSVDNDVGSGRSFLLSLCCSSYRK